MEMEEKHINPNSHKRLRQDTSTSSWSELPQDLLTLVLERLGFSDFEQAKSVCSSWYSVSRNCVPKKQTIPMLVLFPEKDSNMNSCMLFNPGEKDKLYKTKDLGLDFTKSTCMTTYGSWLLMLDHHPYTLYIMNLFTQERIDLPPLPQSYWESERIQFPLFWIDEENKDYVVIWTLLGISLYYTKRGDNSWNYTALGICFADMVYKDHKLYILSSQNRLIIYNFSGMEPRVTFHCEAIQSGRGTKFKLVVTLKGDVLMVDRRLCHVHKVYSSRFHKKIIERDYSLGDEAMLFDLGITVRANDIEGLQRNCIYFNGSNEKNTNEIRFFNLETQKMESLHKFDCSHVQLSKARWFVPSFKSH